MSINRDRAIRNVIEQIFKPKSEVISAKLQTLDEAYDVHWEKVHRDYSDRIRALREKQKAEMEALEKESNAQLLAILSLHPERQKLREQREKLESDSDAAHEEIVLAMDKAFLQNEKIDLDAILSKYK